MTRTLILIIGLIIASVSFSQTDRAAENSDKLIQLKLKNEQVTRKIVDLEALILVLKGELQNTKEEVKSELIRGQELQAQNESSLNIALDELNGKLVPDETDGKILTLLINSGTLELNDNKAIILAD